jgi:uncharacterized membrane protein YdfJ with MMPL/SSD domain
MDKIVCFITGRKRTILTVFIALAVLFGAMIPLIEVNHDLAGYLPPDAPSTKALDIMEAEFTAPMPNATLTAADVTIPEAMELKKALEEVPGVSDVIWLDDVYDVRQPVGMGDQGTIDEFYKDGAAAFSLAIDDGMGEKVETAAKEIAGSNIMTLAKLSAIPFMRFTPRSAPMRKFMKFSAKNPNTVVAALAATTGMDSFIARRMASTGSPRFRRCSSKLCSRNTA